MSDVMTIQWYLGQRDADRSATSEAPQRIRSCLLEHVGRLAVVFGVVFGLMTPLSAQGTLEEREACTPDVFRLCSSFIPDPEAITACLRTRKPDLSVACRKVLFPARSDDLGANATAPGKASR
ncbi:hypothetical protein [Bradyrhizobium sp. USDA 4353]